MIPGAYHPYVTQEAIENQKTLLTYSVIPSPENGALFRRSFYRK